MKKGRMEEKKEVSHDFRTANEGLPKFSGRQ
jgi:hypothetical protein